MTDPNVPTVNVPLGVNTVEKTADAANRAVRTLVQNLVVDAGVAVGGAIFLAVPDVHWTKEWWIAFAGLLGKTAITTGLSYIGRYLAKPKGAVNG